MTSLRSGGHRFEVADIVASLTGAKVIPETKMGFRT